MLGPYCGVEVALTVLLKLTETGGQAGRQTDRQADRQTGRQADRQ